MSTTPNYAASPKIGSVNVSTLDLSLTAPTVAGTVVAAGANGSRIDMATIQATGVTTGGLMRLFLHDGTNYRLIKEVEVRAATPSSTQPAFNASVTFDGGLNLPTGWSLRAAPSKSEAFTVTAFGGDL